MTEESGKSLTRDQISQIEMICDRFERAFQRGQPLTIEAMAAGTETVIRPLLLQRLVELDIQNHAQQGVNADLHSYLARWPDLDLERLKAALSVLTVVPLSDVASGPEILSAARMPDCLNPCSLDEFLSRLRSSGLLSDSEMDSLKASATAEISALSMGTQLVETRKLTAFQLKVLLENSGDPLAPGEYVVLDFVGRGGMGTVYRAVHRRMKRRVALKFIRQDGPHADWLAKRFVREVEVAAKLCHPNIVTAYDAGEFNGQSYLVSEFVEGQNLGELVRQYGPLSLPLAIDVIQQAARALGYAHGEGVIHRDVKPSNLLLDDSGNVKLLDTGLARLTHQEASESDACSDLTATGVIMGTVDYMSPEQAQNASLADERADIYSLGCTLYFLITGRAPYAKGTMIERLIAHREQPVPSFRAISSTLPEELDQLLSMLMAKKASKRIATMEEVVRRIDEMKQVGLPDVTLPLCPMDDEPTGVSLLDESIAPTCLAATSDVTSGDPGNQMSETCVAESPEQSLPADSMDVDSFASLHAPKRSHEPTSVPLAVLEQPADRRSNQRSSWLGSFVVWFVSALAAVAIVVKLAPQQNQEPVNLDVASELPAIADLSGMTVDEVHDYRLQWATALKTDEEQTIDGVVFVFLPPGRFLFGDADEAVEATFDTEYWLSEVEITVGQYRAFVEASDHYQTLAERNASGWGKSDGRWVQRPEFSWKNLGENFVQDNTPACNIAYPDAIAFCEWMSTNSGRTIRLPTEEEWEYACRCGRRGTWSFGDDPEQLDQYAWTRSNSAGEIHTVRGLLPNAWGLFDMHGNEFEWCFEPTAVNGDYSGTGPMRGGSFGSIPELTRSSARHRTRLSESAQGAFRILMERK